MTENKDTEKYTWGSERFNTPFNPGFRSRGISPSYLGSDSLPQGIADLHWALHGIQDNMDKLDARMGSFESNIVKISDGIKDETFKFISDKLAGSKTPLMTNTGYISKIVTTRQRIFSDSFGPETEMNPRNRISGFTENYHWVQYNQKNPNCDGVWDKIIDFDFVADHQQDDNVDSRYVTKGKIILEKVGLINRIHVTQKGTNIVVWYLLSQSMPTDTGVAYTGAIRRVEYNKDAELVTESFVSVNHTPLVLIGAFSADANNEQEFIQYISTDYKLYQNHEGNDKELGQLPNDVITMIDPVNDLLSDSKTAYIMKYSNEGKLLMPLKGFTVTDTLEAGKIVPRFKIIEFNNQTELFKSFVSISPRNQTTLVREFKNDEEMFVEGGYYVELYDISTTKPSTQHSHHFLLSSTEEVYDLDRFAPNVMDAHSVKPSAFSFKRERDYTEFHKITFDGGITKMFPEIAGDFGIGDDVPFTLEFDDSKTTEKITIHLKEPFILTRDISTVEVNNRRGFTVLNNSDFVKDVSAPSILSVYHNLRFINASNPGVRNYLKTMKNYDESYVLPAFFEYNVVKSTEQESQEGVLEVTYFDKDREIKVTIDTKTGNIVGNVNFDENFTREFKDSGAVSPSVKSTLLSSLTNSDTIHLQGKDTYLDEPYKSEGYVLKNISHGSSITQRLFTYSKKQLTVTETPHEDAPLEAPYEDPNPPRESVFPTSMMLDTAWNRDPSEQPNRKIVKEYTLDKLIGFRGAGLENRRPYPTGKLKVELQGLPEFYNDDAVTVTPVQARSAYGDDGIYYYTGSNAKSRIEKVNNNLFYVHHYIDLNNNPYYIKLNFNINGLYYTSSDDATNFTIRITVADDSPVKTETIDITQNVDVDSQEYGGNLLEDRDHHEDVPREDVPREDVPRERPLPGPIVPPSPRPTETTVVADENVVFTRSIQNGHTSEWHGHGYICELKYLGIPGEYYLTSTEDGKFFGSGNPGHRVFKDIVDRKIEVDGSVNAETHVIYTITNELGLSMQYHNIAIREDRTDTIGYTSRPYTLKYVKWIPGEYIGNDDYPLAPDNNSVIKELLKRIARVESNQLKVEDTNSVDLTKEDSVGSGSGTYNLATGEWTFPTNTGKLKADVKLSKSTQTITIPVTKTVEGRENVQGAPTPPTVTTENKSFTVNNGTKINSDGVWSPDLLEVVKELSKTLTGMNERLNQLETRVTDIRNVTNAVNSIVDHLKKSGAWDPNATPSQSTDIRGGLKDGINLAYGNINIFGGSPDGNSYIRTNSGKTENDLAGGI